MKPEKVLDVGTGTGGSAFVLGEIFPEAEVVGVDLAAPYIRFVRHYKELRNASNVNFYTANAESMSYFPDNSFDLINYAYVLHEMPEVNAKAVVREMFRFVIFIDI